MLKSVILILFLLIKGRFMSAFTPSVQEVKSFIYTQCNTCGTFFGSAEKQKLKKADQVCTEVTFPNFWKGKLSSQTGLEIYTPSEEIFETLKNKAVKITFFKNGQEPSICEIDHDCSSFSIKEDKMLSIEEILTRWQNEGISFDFTCMTMENCLEALQKPSSDYNFLISPEIISAAKAALSSYLEFQTFYKDSTNFDLKHGK